jgi:hypothetical protein
MATASTLRTVSRVLASLALVIAAARVAMAVVKHTPIPWTAVLGSVVICALVWTLPEANAPRAGTGS